MPNQTGQSIDGVLDVLVAIAQNVYSAQYDADNGVWAAERDGLQLIVCEGNPGVYQPDLLVMIGTNLEQPIERPTMGTARSRERTAAIAIGFSVFTGAAAAGNAIPAARRVCSGLIADFEDHFRTAGQEASAGACREAWVSHIDGPNPRLSVNAEGQLLGFLSEATITVTAKIRY